MPKTVEEYESQLKFLYVIVAVLIIGIIVLVYLMAKNKNELEDNKSSDSKTKVVKSTSDYLSHIEDDDWVYPTQDQINAVNKPVSSKMAAITMNWNPDIASTSDLRNAANTSTNNTSTSDTSMNNTGTNNTGTTQGFTPYTQDQAVYTNYVPAIPYMSDVPKMRDLY